MRLFFLLLTFGVRLITISLLLKNNRRFKHIGRVTSSFRRGLPNSLTIFQDLKKQKIQEISHARLSNVLLNSVFQMLRLPVTFLFMGPSFYVVSTYLHTYTSKDTSSRVFIFQVASEFNCLGGHSSSSEYQAIIIYIYLPMYLYSWLRL